MSNLQDTERPLELDIPDGVPEAQQAVELIRAWVADGALMVTINGEALGDQLQDWGRLLAQIGHHVANSAALNGQKSDAQALEEIRKGFDSVLPGSAKAAGKVRGRSVH
ncbi:conserved hypothetical protein [Hyphomicrobium sp. GJ21]|jgi:hypothetical protein|uniref:DUF5076 domain-containing protein n=1 Tax=Hyphomicrobium sp. GJ21 TaxID=113574 RepID=UPI000622B5C5|nr:DUF5076 domain-containing protein [Hyphomicrobium sp. GJ21]CEJ85044.1 conserved hypothetical protein [Hyphomicrobium sp. GJ21]